MPEDLTNIASKDQYLEIRRKNACIVRANIFVQLSKMYLSEVPLAGAAAYRTKKGEENILINWDHYERALGQNFTDCIPYEVEHEAQELWLTRGKEKVDPFGPDHYSAINEALKLAHKDGKLDRYMELKRAQMKTFEALGDVHAIEEFDYYKKIVAELIM